MPTSCNCLEVPQSNMHLPSTIAFLPLEEAPKHVCNDIAVC
jgi:hypothetical protein